MNRKLNVTTALGPDTLRFDALRGHEEVSRLFDFSVSMKSEEKYLDPDSMLGTAVTVDIELPGGAKRFLNGQCVRFSALGKKGRYYLYEAQLKPWLWYATRRSDYKVFQNMTVPDMVKQVLAPYPFETRFVLSRGYRSWEYAVQYRETDANFVMRMMEHEGIWFWFEHSAGDHALVITDDIGLTSPFPGYETIPYFSPDMTYPDQDHLDSWSAGGKVKPGTYSARDYNFKMPTAELTTLRSTPAGHAFASYDIFDYPGGYPTIGEGDPYARVRLEELQTTHRRGHAGGRARGLAPGRLFTLERHPGAAHNREYLVIGADYQFSDNDYESNSGSDSHEARIVFETHPSDQPFRPRRDTPKPQTMGPETAVVTGPPGQEIYTNEYGQVKVSFPWNRYCSKDHNSSCWVRVSHPWAGAGFGGMHVPRIGQEVLVDHLNGDPDRPIITSRVYNAFHMPPWGLPANATQSGFLTRSSMGGGYDNANALRFEDKKGEEQLWIHAEKNQDIEVENDETHWVGNDRKKTIDRDEDTQVKRDRTEIVDRHETITVHGNRKEEIDGNETIDIHGNRKEVVDGNEQVTIHKSRTKKIDKNETDKIGKSWSIKVGKSKTETIGMGYMQNVGLGRMENVGLGYSLNVGMLMSTVVGMSQSSKIGQNQSTTVGTKYSLTVGGGGFAPAVSGVEPMHIVAPSSPQEAPASKGSSITMNGDSITLQVGPSKVVITAKGIFLDGPDIHVKAAKTFNADAPDDVHLNSGTAQSAPDMNKEDSPIDKAMEPGGCW